jgi:ribulose-5-phosphate 4-epimerase/fuculose-1-phosphate aldolase
VATYASRSDARAVVHLHSRHAVAVACLADLDPEDAIPVYTAYQAMRVGRLRLVPFIPPGDPALGAAVGEAAGSQPRADLDDGRRGVPVDHPPTAAPSGERRKRAR